MAMGAGFQSWIPSGPGGFKTAGNTNQTNIATPGLNNYSNLNNGNVLQTAGGIAGLNSGYNYQNSSTSSPRLDFNNQDTANFGNLSVAGVDTSGVSQIQNQISQGDMNFGQPQNQNIALAEQQFQGTLNGQDAATRALQAGMDERQSATEAAQRGLQEQQMAQSGSTQAQQNVLRQQQERAFAGERQQNLATLGQQTLARADQAGQQLANLGMQQQQFNMQAQQLDDARDRWESEFGLQAEMSKQDLEKWAAQYNMTVEQAKDMQDQWKSQLFTEQTGIQLTTDQFYDSLNLDKDKMKIANEQWKSEFGLNKIMSEADLEQWAAEYGLTVEQAKQMEEQWTAEFKFQQDKFDESVSQWNDSFGFQKEQYEDQLVQQAIQNGWTEREIQNMESLTELQKTELMNSINKAKYDEILVTTDFTGDTTALENAYKEYMGEDAVIPSYSQFKEQAWDAKEDQAGTDAAAYINNMRGQYFNDDGTQMSYTDASTDAQLVSKLDDLVKAQFQLDDAGYARLSDTAKDNAKRKIYDQMMKSPTQIDREQSLADYVSSAKYQSTLNEDGTKSEETIKLDTLYSDLDFLAQTGGLKPATMPDETLAIVDASGNIVSSNSDYTSTGTLETGGRYVVGSDGSAYFTLDNTSFKVKKVGGEFITGDGKKLDEGTDEYNAASEIFGTAPTLGTIGDKPIADESPLIVTDNLEDAGWYKTSTGGDNIMNFFKDGYLAKFNIEEGVFEIHKNGGEGWEIVKPGEKIDVNDPNSDSVLGKAWIEVDSNGYPTLRTENI